MSWEVYLDDATLYEVGSWQILILTFHSFSFSIPHNPSWSLTIPHDPYSLPPFHSLCVCVSVSIFFTLRSCFVHVITKMRLQYEHRLIRFCWYMRDLFSTSFSVALFMCPFLVTKHLPVPRRYMVWGVTDCFQSIPNSPGSRICWHAYTDSSLQLSTPWG